MLDSCFRNLLWQGQNGVVAELLVSPGEFLRSALETISSRRRPYFVGTKGTKPLHEIGIAGNRMRNCLSPVIPRGEMPSRTEHGKGDSATQNQSDCDTMSASSVETLRTL
jgi:hypothetical protein